ncbi:MAG TPA: c-type cytochrome biogenesis protein CcmI [Candidatus Defluviicoccus seviourii]|nr:c-type cytochrome biogenesis protein CcmI [Candidatus Defluviicoccus seviourii]
MSTLTGAIGALLMACVALVVWPLMRPRPNSGSVDSGTQALRLYRQQLAELDRAAAEDGLDAGEAAALKVEIKRRMLAVAEAGNAQEPPSGQPPSGVRLRLTAAAVALLLAGASIALYGELGTPGIADQPLAARRERAAEASAAALTPEQNQQLETAAAGLARKLAAAPDDIQGWRLLARAHWTLGKLPEALAALRKAYALSGNDPETAADLAEALVAANGGRVGDEAAQLFASIPADAAPAPHARYYLGLRMAQEGDLAGAAATWKLLIAEAPPDAPWLPQVRAQLAHVEAALARGKGVPPADQR